jgi:hypothetical protein
MCVPILGIAFLFSASSAMADGWSMPKIFPVSQKKSKPSSTTKTLKKIDAGTKKFFRDTVDVITLKPLWDSDKNKNRQPVDPWMRSTRKNDTKKSFWDSLFTSQEQPKQPTTVGEWVGMQRPK